MIQFNRGLQSSLPDTLSENELYLTDDTGRLIDGTTGHIVGEDVDVLKVGTEHQHLGRRNSATVGTTNFVGLSGFYYSDIADNGDGTFTLYFADPHPWDATIGQTEIMNANAYPEEFFNHYESGDSKFGIVVYKRFTNVEYLDSWYEDPDTYAATFTTPNDDEWATCITKTKEQLASEFSEFNCCIYDTANPSAGKYFLYRDSLAVGNANQVLNSWASAFGYANIVDGMFGTAVGRNNEVNYAAFGGGRENKAHGWYSAAIGRGNTATGLSSVALGEGNTSTGSATASFGVRSKATAKFSIAGGHQCETLGNGSAAFGNFAKTGEDGDSSFSAGYYSYTNGIGAVALGHSTNAMRVGSFASGMLTHATGDYSIAMGYNTTAEGVYSFTARLESHATGQKATALSWHTTASGNASVATGYNTTASGSCSFTTGQGSEANGKCSVATGYYTRTSTPYSLALGQFNKPEDNALLMVGYGTNDGNRKNVFTVSTTGVVTADKFEGKATKDGNGNIITNTYVSKSVLEDYLYKVSYGCRYFGSGLEEKLAYGGDGSCYFVIDGYDSRSAASGDLSVVVSGDILFHLEYLSLNINMEREYSLIEDVIKNKFYYPYNLNNISLKNSISVTWALGDGDAGSSASFDMISIVNTSSQNRMCILSNSTNNGNYVYFTIDVESLCGRGVSKCIAS